jgi:hypothetical protein
MSKCAQLERHRRREMLVSAAPHSEMERTELTGDGCSISGLLRDVDCEGWDGSEEGTGFVDGGRESRGG